MASEPHKIQLAVQGGGAKIIALLAAAEYVQELQSTKKITITRIAGTSAGAIVACLLAGGVPIGEVRQYLQATPKEKWKKLFRTQNRAIVYGKILANVPLFNESLLISVLKDFFDNRGLSKLGDLKERTGIQVFLTAADISSIQPKIYKENEAFIIQSLLDSCGLPFAYRTARGMSPIIVDGGICENLPSECLESEGGREKFGEIIGISFKETFPTRPKTALQFAKSLLETAMNNSMQRARRQIGSAGVYSIQTNLTTFDIEGATSDTSLGDSWNNVRIATKEYFQPFLVALDRLQANERALLRDPWTESTRELLPNLYRIYKAHHERSPIRIFENTLIAKANCLFRDDDIRSKLPDEVTQIVEFEPAGEPVYCYKMALGSSPTAGFVPAFSCSVFNDANELLPSTLIPIVDPDELAKSKIRRDFLIFFSSPIKAGKHRIVLRDQIAGAMKDIEVNGKDWMGITPRRATVAPYTCQLVLLVPNDFPWIGMRPRATEVRGVEMASQELEKYLYLQSGVRGLGWKGEASGFGPAFSVEFYVRR